MDAKRALAELAGSLVETESVNPGLAMDGSGEGAVAEVVAEWSRAAGLRVEIEEVLPGRPNVVVTAPGMGGGRTLLLNGHLEADVQVSRTNIEKRVEDLNSALQRERMERAVVEGALEAARKDNSRLQSEVAALRSTLRRGAPLDEAPMAPDEAANDEAPAKGKRKGAETA